MAAPPGQFIAFGISSSKSMNKYTSFGTVSFFVEITRVFFYMNVTEFSEFNEL